MAGSRSLDKSNHLTLFLSDSCLVFSLLQVTAGKSQEALGVPSLDPEAPASCSSTALLSPQDRTGNLRGRPVILSPALSFRLSRDGPVPAAQWEELQMDREGKANRNTWR